MSSSTSSFRNELRVVAVVLLVLLAGELVVRVCEQRLSLDVTHIRQIPEISRKMAESQGTRVLFISNSMLRYGVDPAIFEREMEARRLGPLSVGRVFPDATALPDWYYAFKHYFVDANRLPDVLIVCFAAKDLQDDLPPVPARLAHNYTSASDIPELFSHDLLDFDHRADFMLADLSSAYANRARVRTRVLDDLIPSYRESAQIINRSQKSPKKGAGEGGGDASASSAPTYQRLGRLISLARRHHVRVIFVAMPLREEYALDPQVQRIVEAEGMSFFDFRSVDGINQVSFVDEMHLTSGGAATYSQFLARQLAERFPWTTRKESAALVPEP
ncbi:MAG TPA: hypothetical protein VF553_21795 [Pyrinomonadaceae bacterium]|jgi:hypothetical protein